MANLELYKIFVEVSKEKNITRASEKLHIAQPAVTRHIKNLENELNIELFYRKKGMELTEAGKKLYKEVSTLIKQIVDIDKKYSDKNEIIFGTYSSMLSRVLSSSIAKFYSDNKDVKITTITDNSKILNNPLEDGEFDVLVIRKYDDDKYDNKKYKYISLGYMDFVLVANNNSKLCKKKKLKIKDLEGQIVYIPRGDSKATQTLKNMIEKSGMDNEIKRIDSSSMAKIIQEYDNCVGEANTKYLEKEIKDNVFTVLETDFKIPSVEIGIYYKKNKYTKEIKEIIKIIQSKFKL